MNRSTTSRNLLGGFLGGILGILSSWYLPWIALPFGVLVGVIVGWWIEDIAKTLVNSFFFALRFCKSYGFYTGIREFFSLQLKNIESFVAYLNKSGNAFFQWIASCLQFFMNLPKRFARWLPHPASMAILISVSAVLVGATLVALSIGFLWPWPETITTRAGMGHPEIEKALELSEIVMITLAITAISSMCGLMGVIRVESNSSLHNFYSRWSRYSQVSGFSYFRNELNSFLRAQIAIITFFVIAITYWITLGGALIVLVTIPCVTIIAFMVGLYNIAQRSAHWWCFGVTLTVTTASAIIFYESFSNEMFLWTVALCTGVLSGLLTEGLWNLGAWWGNTKTGEYCLLELWYNDEKILPFSIVTSWWKKLDKVFDDVITKPIQNYSFL